MVHEPGAKEVSMEFTMLKGESTLGGDLQKAQ